jgi:hypothetical protein
MVCRSGLSRQRPDGQRNRYRMRPTREFGWWGTGATGSGSACASSTACVGTIAANQSAAARDHRLILIKLIWLYLLLAHQITVCLYHLARSDLVFFFWSITIVIILTGLSKLKQSAECNTANSASQQVLLNKIWPNGSRHDLRTWSPADFDMLLRNLKEM